MRFLRPKHPGIYPAVWKYFEKSSELPYIAHAIIAGGPGAAPTVVRLREESTGTSGGSNPSNHPDQLYWATANTKNTNPMAIPGIANALSGKVVGNAAGNILRIEIDCPLLPCAQDKSKSCLYLVPKLIEKYYLTKVPLRIFSHRAENYANNPSESDKRVFNCNSGDNNTALEAAFNDHGDWSWTSWANSY